MEFSFTNNMILAGAISPPKPQGSLFGLVSRVFGGGFLANNTFVAGSGAPSISLRMNYESTTKSKHELVGNLFVGSDDPEGVAIQFAYCPQAWVTRFESNALVRSRMTFDVPWGGKPVLCDDPLKLGVPPPETLSQWQSFLALSCPPGDSDCLGRFSGNQDIQGSCDDEAQPCVALDGCQDQTSCAEALFSSWSAQDSGVAALLGGGWKLRPDLGCPVHRIPKSVKYSDDRFSTDVRTGEYISRGAHEQPECIP